MIKKDYISVPIAFEAGLKFDDNPYYQLINKEHVGDLTGCSQISYRNPEKVEGYLLSYPEITDFLSESWSRLEKHFGKDVRVVLEVISHPGEHPYEELVGWIQSMDQIEVGLDKLEKFEEEWLTEQLQKVGNVFNFNIEFT